MAAQHNTRCYGGSGGGVGGGAECGRQFYFAGGAPPDFSGLHLASAHGPQQAAGGVGEIAAGAAYHPRDPESRPLLAGQPAQGRGGGSGIAGPLFPRPPAPHGGAACAGTAPSGGGGGGGVSGGGGGDMILLRRLLEANATQMLLQGGRGAAVAAAPLPPAQRVSWLGGPAAAGPSAAAPGAPPPPSPKVAPAPVGLLCALATPAAPGGAS